MLRNFHNFSCSQDWDLLPFHRPSHNSNSRLMYFLFSQNALDEIEIEHAWSALDEREGSSINEIKSKASTFSTLIFDDILTHDLINFSFSLSILQWHRKTFSIPDTQKQQQQPESAKIASLQLECAHEEIFFEWKMAFLPHWYNYNWIFFFRLPFLYVTRDIIPIEVCATTTTRRPKSVKKNRRELKENFPVVRQLQEGDEKSAK